MVIETNHQMNVTNNSIQFTNDYNNSSDISQEFQPIWISIPLISSKLSIYLIFTISIHANDNQSLVNHRSVYVLREHYLSILITKNKINYIGKRKTLLLLT